MADRPIDTTLTTKQMKAVEALLQAETIRHAAEMAGISERTLYRWLKDPRWEHFQAEYGDARRQATRHAVGRLQAASSDAVTILRRIMFDESQQGAARVAAARSILEFAFKGSELQDLSERIAALEAITEAQNADIIDQKD